MHDSSLPERLAKPGRRQQIRGHRRIGQV